MSLVGPTSKVRGRRSGEAAEGTGKPRLPAVPLDRNVRHGAHDLGFTKRVMKSIGHIVKRNLAQTELREELSINQLLQEPRPCVSGDSDWGYWGYQGPKTLDQQWELGKKRYEQQLCQISFESK